MIGAAVVVAGTALVLSAGIDQCLPIGSLLAFHESYALPRTGSTWTAQVYWA